MTHDDARLLVSALADGEAQRTPDLDAHLANCADCAAYEAGVARLTTLAAALPRPVAPPALVTRVTARVRRRRRWLRLVPAVAVATGLAVVATNLPAGPAAFRLPPAAAAEPLLHLRSLYVERTVTDPESVTAEKVWWQAPGFVRVETTTTYGNGTRRESVRVSRPGERWVDGVRTRNASPDLALPEPLSPTVALLGDDRGPGPVVAGLPTRRYELTVGGQTRTAYVADGITLGGTESVVLGKLGPLGVVKTTQVVRLNPDLAPQTFTALPQARRETDGGFRAVPLADLAIRPERRLEGFAAQYAGRGRDGEAYLLVRGAMQVLVREGRLRDTGTVDYRTVPYGGRDLLATVGLYEPPAIQVTTGAGVVTVSAPLPLESLAALAAGLYDLE